MHTFAFCGKESKGIKIAIKLVCANLINSGKERNFSGRNVLEGMKG